MLAQRIFVQVVLPGRFLMTTATRTAGSRFLITGLLVLQVVLALLVYCEKTFGLRKKLEQTLRFKSRIEQRLEEEQCSMLELVLQRTRANLGSMSSIDEDGPEQGRGAVVATPSLSCPLCHGTGTITYEGKLKHEGEPCPRCALIRSNLDLKN
jgi:hypothetical protein